MPDKYGNPTGRDWVGLGENFRKSAADKRDRQISNLTSAYLTAMKQGNKIDTKSPDYFAPAHLAASTLIHTENLENEKYRGQIMDNDIKEFKLRHAQDAKRIDQFLALPDDQIQDAFLQVDQLVNASGDDYTGIEKGEDGKEYYVGTNAAGRPIRSKTPIYSPQQIRETVERYRNPDMYIKMRMNNRAGIRAWNEKANLNPEFVVDKDGNEAYLYHPKNRETGNIESYAITRDGKKISGKQLNKYQPFEDYKTSQELKLKKEKKKGGLSPSATAANKRWAIDKAQKYIENWEMENGPLPAGEKQAWLPELTKKFSEMAVPGEQKESQQKERTGINSKMSVNRLPGRTEEYVKENFSGINRKVADKEKEQPQGKDEGKKNYTVGEIVDDIFSGPDLEGLKKELKAEVKGGKMIKVTDKEVMEMASSINQSLANANTETLKALIGKYKKAFKMLADGERKAINFIRNIETPFKKES